MRSIYWAMYFQRRTEEDSQQARKFAQESISLDPGYGAPYLLLAKLTLMMFGTTSQRVTRKH